jgi:hypothetical protein
MQINTCLRCDRPWCYRGTGRATRCGVCKSPYWDRARTLGAQGSAVAPRLRPNEATPTTSLPGDIFHHGGVGASVHRLSDPTAKEARGTRTGTAVASGSVGEVAGVEMDRADSATNGGKKTDSSAATKPKHSEQMKQSLRDICAGKGLGSIKYHNIDTDPMGRALASIPRTEIPICSFRWWEDGEQYECLMDAGHSIPLKHGRNGMVRRVDE